MYSLPSGAIAQSYGAPPWRDSPEYTDWFERAAVANGWKKTVLGAGFKKVVAYDTPEGVWSPSVGVVAGVIPAAAPQLRPVIQPQPPAVAEVAPPKAAVRVATVQAASEATAMAAPLSWPTAYPEWAAFLSTWGLTPEAAVRALALGHYVTQLSGRRLIITSGLRTAEKQASLLAAWKRGDPSVRSKPASDSYHLKGLAFDAVYEDGSNPDALVGAVANALGLRWGASFGDVVHFDTAVVKVA